MPPSIEALPLGRGGLLFPTAAGWIQYGVVPETIKDTMVLPGGVPAIYVIPQRLFCTERGISLAELEFPCYFNFFIKNHRTTIVCRQAQRAVLEGVLSEAVFGPAELDGAEFSGRSSSNFPDLRSEMSYFRRNPRRDDAAMKLEDLVEFVEFDAGGVARLASGVAIVLEQDGGIGVLEDGILRARFPADPPLPRRPGPYEGPLRAFWMPLLGLSVIGSGHGFDPANRTSGFIIWIEGRGVMVDPPVDSIDWLRGYDISSRQIDTLILTHCHADHDAGTLQKILEEGRISIYTTPTVMQSFVAKYAPLTGLPPERFRSLFDFVPVKVGDPVYLHGAEATFRYSLHSIPCAGFDIKLRGRSLLYPSDTLNEPRIIHRLHEQGVLDQERRDSLLAFPWHHNLVLHEAGIPPIHTPIEYLSTLEEEIKKKTLLVHVSEKAVPPGSGLQVAPTGLEATIDLGAAHLPVQEALEILDVMGRVEIFSELPAPRAAEFLRMVQKEYYAEGETLFGKGEPGDRFYIVLQGRAAAWRKGAEFKVYSAFDYFGETAILLDQPRRATVKAKTLLVVLTLRRAAFLHLLRGTDLPDRLVHLARLRELPSWELLSESPILRDFTSNQKTQLQTLMEPVTLEAGAVLGSDPLLVHTGLLRVLVDGQAIDLLEMGAFAGDVQQLVHDLPTPYRFEAVTQVTGFRFDRRRLPKFFQDNPGAYMQLAEVTSSWQAAARAGRTLPAR
ncbi:MAG: cAMP/cGMP-dependent 3',5'-cyclic-AMP/GMP phosphodiesterase [Candidatus Wallbacteria bacterium]|nr:cAMP/cGMP-dependent 3',5'-cyclic-AMP/GMP phosphodiesterase [Candidatus Wallbacteria bacterium]